MRGRNYCWFFFFLTLLSSDVFAATYFYRTDGKTSSDAPSAGASASAYAAWYPTVYNFTLSVTSVTKYNSTGQTFKSCFDSFSKANGEFSTNFCKFTSRSGDSCPTGQTFDPEQGACADPSASCPVGQSRNPISGLCEPHACPQDSTGDEVVYSPKQAKCTKNYNLDAEEYCTYSGQKKTPTTQPLALITNDPDGVTQGVDNFKCGIDVTSKQCATKADGTHRCIVTGTSNGTFYPNATDNNVPNCPSGTCTTAPETPVPETPKPETTTDSKPCNYTSVNGALTCTSSSSENKEGTKNCGTVNGSWQCVKAPPSSNGIDIVTNVVTESTADGGTKTTKTDTATQTKCTDIAKCTTSTTTNVNVTIKDGQGNTTSTSGTCKGDNCPDENGNPDANGDGFGDCVGDDCGEDEETKVGAQDWYQEGEDTYASVLGDFADRVANIPVVAGVDNFLSVTPTGACPVWQVDAWVFHIRLDQFCQGEIPWDLIRAIVIGCFAFLAFRIAFL